MSIIVTLLILISLVCVSFIVPWVVSYLIPKKMFDVYMQRYDRIIDWGVSQAYLTFMGIFGYIIFVSWWLGGPVGIDATYFHEAEIELIILSVLMIMGVVHTSLQLRRIRVK